MTGVTVVVDHPLVLDKLTQMRRKDTPNGRFRHLLREVGKLLLFEATRDLPLTMEAIETPIATTEAPALASGGLCLASILRAGMGFLEGMLELVPEAGVAFVGMYREEATHEPVEYYFKAPADLAERLVIVVDPMLATGNTAVATLDRLKARGATRLRFCCLLAAPEGVARLHEVHPDVDLYTAAIDERLDENAFIVPGLGDAGDRLFGTP